MTDKEIIEALATKVMGWTPTIGGLQGRGETIPKYWRTPKERRMSSWNPLKDPADSKRVREKLAERFNETSLCRELFRERWTFSFSVWNFNQATAKREGPAFYGTANTEERAVALCALKTVGIDTERPAHERQ